MTSKVSSQFCKPCPFVTAIAKWVLTHGFFPLLKIITHCHPALSSLGAPRDPSWGQTYQGAGDPDPRASGWPRLWPGVWPRPWPDPGAICPVDSKAGDNDIDHIKHVFIFFMVCIDICADVLFYFRWVFVSRQHIIAAKLLSRVKQNEKWLDSQNFFCVLGLLYSYNIYWLIVEAIYHQFWSVLLTSLDDNCVCVQSMEGRVRDGARLWWYYHSQLRSHCQAFLPSIDPCHHIHAGTVSDPIYF